MNKQPTNFVLEQQNLSENLMKAVFVRAYRWTLESETLSPTCISRVSMDFLDQKIAFSVLEVSFDGGPINAHEFKRAIIKWPGSEDLRLNTHDPVGDIIYTHSFKDLKCVSCKETFDYTNSDIASIEFVISFKSSSIQMNHSKQKAVNKRNTDTNSKNKRSKRSRTAASKS